MRSSLPAEIVETPAAVVHRDPCDRLYGFRSHPIPDRKGRRVAVRVVNQFGEEGTKVVTAG